MMARGGLSGPGPKLAGLSQEACAMAMIFPGMDPYVEDPGFWPGFHNRMVVYLADQLQPRIEPRYIAKIEDRVYVEGLRREIVPDDVLRRERPVTGRDGIAVLEDPSVDAPVLVRVP